MWGWERRAQGSRILPVNCLRVLCVFGLPRWLSSKESACNAGDLGWIPGLERSSGGGNGNPFQYSCLENPMEGGVSRSTVHGDMTEHPQHSVCMYMGFVWLGGKTEYISMSIFTANSSLECCRFSHFFCVLGKRCQLLEKECQYLPR